MNVQSRGVAAFFSFLFLAVCNLNAATVAATYYLAVIVHIHLATAKLEG